MVRPYYAIALLLLTAACADPKSTGNTSGAPTQPERSSTASAPTLGKAEAADLIWPAVRNRCQYVRASYNVPAPSEGTMNTSVAHLANLIQTFTGTGTATSLGGGINEYHTDFADVGWGRAFMRLASRARDKSY